MGAQAESSGCRSPLAGGPGQRRGAGDSECSPLREERDLRGGARCPQRALVLACLLGFALSSCASTPTPQFHDDFSSDLSNWVVEQQPGGTVAVEDGRLVIADVGGCTVWFKHKLEAPVIITYTATVSSKARVSDLNCFWMATDPSRPDDLLAPGHKRTGAFATYDTLRTYYVGYGGNYNSTTRFRRYNGDGTKPLLPKNDLSAPEYLLKPDHAYHIALVVVGSRVQYQRDGEVVFDYTDPEPLTSGWFGFRTVKSRIEIQDFKVRQATASDLMERK